MGSEADPELNSTPKLSYLSLPTKSTEPPGMSTPPFCSLASVPFHWEEAPGRPRTCTNTTLFHKEVSSAARCLELPPRLLVSEVKITSLPSPTTVLEGSYVNRSSSYSLSFSRERRKPSPLAHSPRFLIHGNDRRGSFGSWVRRGLKGNTRVAEDTCAISPSSASSSGAGDGVGDDDTKVKITRFRRTGSFSVLSFSGGTKSHLWATLKQVVPVPWRGSSKKMKKDNGSTS